MHNNKLLALLLEQLPLGVIITDATGKCLAASAYMRKMWNDVDFNVPIENFHDIPTCMFHLDGTPYRKEEWPIFRAMKSQPVKFEVCKIILHEKTFYAEMSAIPVFELGRLRHICIICEDVTEKQKLQEEASLNRVRTDFMARMSHEIRTPMHGILGMLDVMLDDTVTKKQEEQLSVIKRSTQRLLTVLNDILDFGKLDAGFVELDKAPFDLRDLLYDIKTVFSSKKDVVFTLAIADTLPIPIYGDSHRISQCLNNLISNATKFVKPNQPATVSVKVSTDTESIIITVSDNGIGMTEVTIRQLFSSFVQGDRNITRTYGGTGLGLAITKQLIQLMGGSISVQSSLGQGSIFTVRLPLEEPPSLKRSRQSEIDLTELLINSPPKRIKTELDEDLSPIKILLAEDNPISRQLAEMLLSKRGFNVTSCENGQEVLNILEEKDDYDILLLDIQMPVMDGHETCRILRDQKWGKPIVALTASAMESDRKTCLLAGMTDYMSKPFRIGELERKIKGLVHSCR